MMQDWSEMMTIELHRICKNCTDFARTCKTIWEDVNKIAQLQTVVWEDVIKLHRIYKQWSCKMIWEDVNKIAQNLQANMIIQDDLRRRCHMKLHRNCKQWACKKIWEDVKQVTQNVQAKTMQDDELKRLLKKLHKMCNQCCLCKMIQRYC